MLIWVCLASMLCPSNRYTRVTPGGHLGKNEMLGSCAHYLSIAPPHSPPFPTCRVPWNIATSETSAGCLALSLVSSWGMWIPGRPAEDVCASLLGTDWVPRLEVTSPIRQLSLSLVRESTCFPHFIKPRGILYCLLWFPQSFGRSSLIKSPQIAQCECIFCLLQKP